MPSRLQKITREGLYRKAYDRKRFVICVGTGYYESRYFNSYTALKRGRMIVYTGEDGMLGKCNIGVIVQTMPSEDMIRIRLIAQAHLKEDSIKYRQIHASDVYCYLEQVAGVNIKPVVKERCKLYRFWSVHRNKGGKDIEATIKVGGNLQTLLADRNRRQKAADEYAAGLVTYYVREISNV